VEETVGPGGVNVGGQLTGDPLPTRTAERSSTVSAEAVRGLDSTAPFAMQPGADSIVGARVGRYTIRQTIGFGGMGLVVAAYDSELGRSVAIKLVAGDSDQARRRLVREAQAMARLSHPNVVTVHEVIRLGERAGIVMELVDGDNLATWCAARERGWHEIVAAYVQAARGLAAAHRAGLVHRDFKPSNALIDNQGVVRVTDFGLVRVARSGAVDAPLAGEVHAPPAGDMLDVTLTRTGSVMGTPAYMAPEQHRGVEIDARTDQWALACSLYTALHRQRPFAGETHDELRTAVLAGAVRAEPTDTAVPRAIRAAIRRALALDPADRFATMEELIAALSPKRRAWQMAAALAAIALAGGTAAVLAAGGADDEARCTGLDAPMEAVWNPARADQLRAQFAATGNHAEIGEKVVAALDGHGARWVRARTRACTDARQGVGSSELLDRRMRCLDERLVEMSAAVEALSRADADMVRGAGDAVDRLHPAAECDDPRDSVPRPADPRARAEIAAAEDTLARGWALQALSQYEAAAPLARQAAAVGERTGWSPLLARALILLGDCQDRQMQYSAALASYDRAATVAAQARDDAAVVDALARRFLVLGEHLGQPAAALEGRTFIELALERAGRPPHLRALWLHFLAIMLLKQDEAEDALAIESEAVAIWRGLVPAGHVLLVDSLETLGNIHIQRGELDRAEALLHEVLAAKSSARGPGHLSVADTLTNLGVLDSTRGRLTEAIDSWKRAVAISDAAGAPACVAMLDIGLVRFQLGQWRASADQLATSLSCVERRRPGKASKWVGMTASELGYALMALGELDRAAQQLDRGVEILRASGSKRVVDALAQAARLSIARGDRATARGRVDEAKKHGSAVNPLLHLAEAEVVRAEAGCREARAIYELAIKVSTEENPLTRFDATTGLAECLSQLGRPADAVAALEPELAWLDEVGADRGTGARARLAMARALIAAGGDRKRARSLADAARAGFATLGAPGERRAAEVARWAARLR
jgi:tetratricopeptide (TPR) repeat protein